MIRCNPGDTILGPMMLGGNWNGKLYRAKVISIDYGHNQILVEWLEQTYGPDDAPAVNQGSRWFLNDMYGINYVQPFRDTLLLAVEAAIRYGYEAQREDFQEMVKDHVAKGL